MFKDIFFTKEEVLKAKSSTDPELKKYIDTVIERADDCVEKGLSGLTGYDDTNTVLSLCFAYYYTDENKYSDLALEIIKHKIYNENWLDSGYDPKANKGFDIKASLEAGHKCVDLSFLLSYFGQLLPEETKKEYALAIYVRGILPIFEDWVLPNRKIHALDTMGHNFWIFIVENGALMTLVLREYLSDAEYLLDIANRCLEAWFKYEGNPLNAKPRNVDNGGYYESTGYSEVYSHSYVYYAKAYEKAYGKHPFDDTEIMNEIGNFHIQTFYSSDEADYAVDFGDGGNNVRNTQFALIYYGLGTPELRWFAKESRSPAVDVFLRIATWDEVHSKEAYPPKEISAFYRDIGWATFRDRHEKNSTMLAIKCGDTWNHAHADCAHFTLFRNGTKEVYDSGSPAGYSKPTYQQYYVTSQAHNVLLFNGKGQDYRDNYKNHAHVPGKLLNYVDDRGFRYIVADGTGPMGRYFRKHHRHFLWLDGFILIYDDVECYESGTVSFLLHAKEKNCFKMFTPCSVTKHDGYINKSEIPNDTYTSFNINTDDEDHAKFVSILLLDESLSPIYEEIDEGCKITCGKTTVYINFRSDGKVMHRNCINIMDGITTDAVILVESDGRYGVVNGSIVRKDGISHLDTWARMTGWTDTAKKIDK